VCDSISIEQTHTPTVILVNEGFHLDSQSAASTHGMPTLRVIPEGVPCECSVVAEINAKVLRVMDSVIEAMTKPLSDAERSPKNKNLEKPPRIIFSGDATEINQFYYRRGWGDGLPLVPPTEEAITEMLTGTDLPRDYLVGEIYPRNGKATVERIAINAVMAGALPTHLPVLIAMVQAAIDKGACLGTYGASTGSWSPFWVINGPIRNEIHVNSGSGAMSPGNIANAAIGRAMGLIIKNIGGIRKGVEDMGVLGNPGKYSLVIGENEEQSPWEPLHVENGLEPEDSAVSVFFPNCYSQIWPYGSDDRGILSAIIYNLIPAKRGMTCFILTPPQAQAMKQAGWTKNMIRTFITQNASTRAYRHPVYWNTTIGGGMKETIPLNAMDTVPLLRNPEWLRIIVAGGPGNFLGIFAGASLIPGIVKWVTQKVEFPKNWDQVVNKYRNLVPQYALY
jgi:hypothetical protein